MKICKHCLEETAEEFGWDVDIIMAGDWMVGYPFSIMNKKVEKYEE